MERSDSQVDALSAMVLSGDPVALGQLFEAYREKLRKMIAFRLAVQLQGRVDPSDVLQEAFIDMVKRLPELSGKGDLPVLVWLRLVVLEKLCAMHRMHFAAQKRDVRRDVSIHNYLNDSNTQLRLADALIDELSSIDRQAIQTEEREKLHAIIAEMDPMDREVIAMRIFEDLSNNETAIVLGITKQAASRRFISAIQRLRTQIQSFGESFHFE
jgi:RNA polymerase sigma-70 factor (ECF subfamily)